jgi:hypothetical protein
MKHLQKETDNARQTSTRRKSRCHRRARSEDCSRGQSRHTGPRARSEDRSRGRGRHTRAPSADLASIRWSGSASLRLLADVPEQLDPRPSGGPGFGDPARGAIVPSSRAVVCAARLTRDIRPIVRRGCYGWWSHPWCTPNWPIGRCAAQLLTRSRIADVASAHSHAAVRMFTRNLETGRRP